MRMLSGFFVCKLRKLKNGVKEAAQDDEDGDGSSQEEGEDEGEEGVGVGGEQRGQGVVPGGKAAKAEPTVKVGACARVRVCVHVGVAVTLRLSGLHVGCWACPLSVAWAAPCCTHASQPWIMRAMCFLFHLLLRCKDTNNCGVV